eukprot:scaffold201_cov405-Prasinococcus_capsulatus_cf.AAC.13
MTTTMKLTDASAGGLETKGVTTRARAGRGRAAARRPPAGVPRRGCRPVVARQLLLSASAVARVGRSCVASPSAALEACQRRRGRPSFARSTGWLSLAWHVCPGASAHVGCFVS